MKQDPKPEKVNRAAGKLHKGEPWLIPGMGTLTKRWRKPHRRRTKRGAADVRGAGVIVFRPLPAFRDAVFGRVKP